MELLLLLHTHCLPLLLLVTPASAVQADSLTAANASAPLMTFSTGKINCQPYSSCTSSVRFSSDFGGSVAQPLLGSAALISRQEEQFHLCTAGKRTTASMSDSSTYRHHLSASVPVRRRRRQRRWWQLVCQSDYSCNNNGNISNDSSGSRGCRASPSTSIPLPSANYDRLIMTSLEKWREGFKENGGI